MKKGFTLIEFIIYIAISGIFLVTAGALVINIFYGKAKLSAIEEVSQNARMAMEKISERIRNAQSVNNPGQGISDQTLSLEMIDAQINPTVFDFYDGAIRIKEGVSSAVTITSSEVIVTNLQFHNISYPATPGTIRVQMTLKFNNPENKQEYNFEKTFFTTANLRTK